MKQSDNQMETIVEQLRAGNRRALARAITLVESGRADHRGQAEKLLKLLLPHGRDTLRLGISGAPGVGKSTFIEAFGLHLIDAGERVAVLAVDPSSSLTGGSILGDKTRMDRLSKADAAFIRPTPSGGGLGGVARRSREAMLLCEAAGYSTIIVETVGVGQSEIAVAGMTDMFLLLQAPGGGDELQGIKRGIMELVDLLVVNKADGDFLRAAQHAASDYRSVLTLMRPRSEAWRAQVVTASALKATGLDAVWQAVLDYRECMKNAGLFQATRTEQLRHWLWQEVQDGLNAAIHQDSDLAELSKELEQAVVSGREPATAAARQIIATFLKS